MNTGIIISTLLVFQAVVFAIGLFSAVISRKNTESSLRLPLWSRMFLSSSLLLSSYLIWNQSTYKTAAYSKWIFIGMFFSFLGDICMAGFIPYGNRVVMGIMLFSGTHGLYINSYVSITNYSGYLLQYSLFGRIFIFLTIIIIFAWRMLVWKSESSKLLKVAVLAYGLWLGTMASTAAAMAFSLGWPWYATALESLLFFVSDFLIAATKIGTLRIKNSEIIIWFTYVSGQIGIIYTPWLYSILL